MKDPRKIDRDAVRNLAPMLTSGGLKTRLLLSLMPISIGNDDVNGITIGGDKVQEVTVDGNVVWTSIPNSAIHRWKFSEGSGSTAVDSIGGADGTLQGASWASGSWVGDYALNGDGSNDYVETTTWGDFGSNMDSDFAVAYTISSTDSSTNSMVAGCRPDTSSTDAGLEVMYNHGHYNLSQGAGLNLNDGSSGVMLCTNDGVADGGTHRFVINKITNDPSNWEIWQNGTSVSTNIKSDEGVSGFSNFSTEVRFFEWGNGERRLNGVIDNFIVFNDSLTSQEIQNDYERQPWS